MTTREEARATRAKEGEHKITCPLCGVMRMRPRPHVPSTPWAGCACSDMGRCLYHQVHGDETPPRPSEEVMQQRAEARMARQMENWTRLRAAFGEYVASRIPHDHGE